MNMQIKSEITPENVDAKVLEYARLASVGAVAANAPGELSPPQLTMKVSERP